MKREIVFEPGDHLVTITDDGHAVEWQVREDGRPDRYGSELTHAHVATRHPESYLLVDLRGALWVLTGGQYWQWTRADLAQATEARAMLDRLIAAGDPRES